MISEPTVVRNLAAGEALAGDFKAARKRVRLALRRHPNAEGLRAYSDDLARHQQKLDTADEAHDE